MKTLPGSAPTIRGSRGEQATGVGGSLWSGINPIPDLIQLGQASPANSGSWTRPGIADPLRSPWVHVALAAIFLTPVAAGFALESRWLTQAGFIVLFMFILGVTGCEMQRWPRREEVRENVRRILEEGEEQGFDR
jgi:hypothetical protein